MCLACPAKKINALLADDWLKKIVDHKNYNPIIIASVSSQCIEQVSASEYPKYIVNALDNPQLIWEKAFSSLELPNQNLLICIFFFSSFGVDIEDLKSTFLSLHRSISHYYSRPTSPSDFVNALKTLESGFITISGSKVNYVNPSLRDYLQSYLNDIDFLTLLPETSVRVDWARSVWHHVKSIFKGQD